MALGDSAVRTLPIQTYTPTITNGPTGTAEGFYRRVGDCIVVSGDIAVTGAGAASVMTIGLPSGLTVDTTKLGAAGAAALGTAKLNLSGSIRVGVTVYNATNTFVICHSGSTGNAVLGNAFANGDVVCWEATLPISGWN